MGKFLIGRMSLIILTLTSIGVLEFFKNILSPLYSGFLLLWVVILSVYKGGFKVGLISSLIGGAYLFLFLSPQNVDLFSLDGWMLQAAFFVPALSGSAWMFSTLKRNAEKKLQTQNESLRILTGRLQIIREEERKRVAREVHDRLGQELTGLKMNFTALMMQLSKSGISIPEEIFEKSREMNQAFKVAIDSVHEICMDLRPSLLDHLGLPAAIELQAHEFQRRTGVQMEMQLDHRLKEFSSEKAIVFFRILQEILMNIQRHAGATKTKIRLAYQWNHLILAVQDNGRGIHKSEMNDMRSLGILGMQERASAIGGRLMLKGYLGRGTTVTVKVPIER